MFEFTSTQAISIANRLRTERRNKGLKQEELAEMTDVDVRTIQRTESVNYPQPVCHVLFWMKLAEIYETTVEYLINGKK